MNVSFLFFSKHKASDSAGSDSPGLLKGAGILGRGRSDTVHMQDDLEAAIEDQNHAEDGEDIEEEEHVKFATNLMRNSAGIADQSAQRPQDQLSQFRDGLARGVASKIYRRSAGV